MQFTELCRWAPEGSSKLRVENVRCLFWACATKLWPKTADGRWMLHRQLAGNLYWLPYCWTNVSLRHWNVIPAGRHVFWRWGQWLLECNANGTFSDGSTVKSRELSEGSKLQNGERWRKRYWSMTGWLLADLSSVGKFAMVFVITFDLQIYVANAACEKPLLRRW